MLKLRLRDRLVNHNACFFPVLRDGLWFEDRSMAIGCEGFIKTSACR